MRGDRGGQHNSLPTADPEQPDKKLQVLSICVFLHESRDNAGNAKIRPRRLMLSVIAWDVMDSTSFPRVARKSFF